MLGSVRIMEDTTNDNNEICMVLKVRAYLGKLVCE